MSKAFYKANLEANPRFKESIELNSRLSSLFPVDKRQVGVHVNRDGYSDETILPQKSAWSNSVYSWRFLWWWNSYPANNAIYGHSYWCSTGHHGTNDIIIWESSLWDLTRIHGINIVWAYAPKRYAVEYSRDGTKFETLVDWRDAITGGTATWWQNLIPFLKTARRSFPDRITFDHPVFAKKVRILMKNPVNYYFGLYRVDLYVKNWVMVLKQQRQNQCREDCWVVNTISPQQGTVVKTTDCVGSIGYGENRELFTLLYDSRLIHFNSGMCVVSGYSKDVHLEQCHHASSSGDGREKFVFWRDGRITNQYSNDECIYLPDDAQSDTIEGSAIVEATSEIADGGHAAFRVTDGNEGSYWASNPGDEIATITLYFKKWESMNDLHIDWKYEATSYDIFAYTLENGWKLILRVTGNTKKRNDLKLKRINAKAIQIKMNATKKTFLGKSIYALTTVSVTDGAINLKRRECNKVNKNSKLWILENQFYTYVGNKPPYIKAYNQLTQTYLRLRGLNRKINLDFKEAQKAKSKAQQIRKLLEKTNDRLAELLSKIKKFKTEKYAVGDSLFEMVLKKFGIEYFYPYLTKPESNNQQVGAVFTSPAKDCWEIKRKIPQKKSGFFWIQPQCSPKPLRVWCDFSTHGIGTSIYLWKSEFTTFNTPIIDTTIKSRKDIQKQCAKIGLFPIEIKSSDMVGRITQYMKILGVSLHLPILYPLGFDWGCEKGSCSLNYRSFNKKSSLAVNTYFPIPEANIARYNKIVKYNTLGLGYSGVGKPFYFNINNAKIGGLICSTNEHNPPISDPTEARLSCSDIFAGNSKLDASIGTDVKINCPAFCAEKSEHKVFGTGPFGDLSSVCRAAVYAGLIKDGEGGVFKLKVGPASNSFKSLKANGIKTIESNKHSPKTFTLEKFTKKCPIEFFKSNEDKKETASPAGSNTVKSDPIEDKVEKSVAPQAHSKKIPFKNAVKTTASFFDPPKPKPVPVFTGHHGGLNYNFFKFLEVGSQISMSEQNMLAIKDKEAMKGELETLSYEALNSQAEEEIGEEASEEKTSNENQSTDELEVMKKESGIADPLKKGAENLLGKGKDLLKDAQGKAKKAAAAVAKKAKKAGQSALKNAIGKANLSLNNRSNKLKDKINQMKMGGNPKTSPAKASNEKKEKKKKEQCVLSTDVFIKEITTFRHYDYNSFKHFKKFGNQMKNLLSEYKSEYKFFEWPSQLSNRHFFNTFEKLTKIAQYLQQLFSKVREKSEERINQTNKRIELLKKKLANYSQTHNSGLDYSKNIKDQLTFFHFKLAQNYPGKWSFLNSSIEGRSQTVHQSSQIYSNISYGSLTLIKDKVYYDFRLKVDILTRSTGSIGVVFRLKDAFNFYAYEINIKGGFKRLVRVKHGVYKTLQQIDDGGIAQNTWYKVQIKANRNKIIIRTGEDKKFSKYSDAKVAFEFYNESFVSGKVGLFTNGNNDFYFDKLIVESFSCQNKWQLAKGTSVFPDKSSLYYENYDETLHAKYDIINPKNSKMGPARWYFAKGLYKRDILLRQSSRIADKDDDEFSKAVLKHVVSEKGSEITFEFRASHTGVVGCVFRYVDNNSYYAFTIGGGSDVKKRFFELKKKFKGKFSSIKKFGHSSELPTVPFFGYDPTAWYSVKILVQKERIKVFMSLIGSTERLKILDASDRDIKEGRVGFLTSGTEAVFGEIEVRPTKLIYSEKEIPSKIPQSETEEDVLLVDFFNNTDSHKKPKNGGNKKNGNGGKNKDKNSNPKSPHYRKLNPFIKNPSNKPWKKCVRTSKPEDRQAYCKQLFMVSKSAQNRCTGNFCSTCCGKLVPSGHNVESHHCLKECSASSAPSTHKNSELNWKVECINPPTNKKSIYSYCDRTFPNEKLLQHNCKIDSCRLCCATSDRAFHQTSQDIRSQNECFKACANLFKLK